MDVGPHKILAVISDLDGTAVATSRRDTHAQIIDRVGAHLARGAGVVCQVLDPDLIVIGGGLSRAGSTLLTVVERHLRRRTLVPPRVALSSLGDTAVAYGALRTALDRANQDLFTAPWAT
jgi:predicted NBD/HSP70 family sugar kinase